MSADSAPSHALAQLGELSTELAHELHNLLLTIALSAHAARLAPAHSDAHWLKVQAMAELGQALVRDVMTLAQPAPLPREPLPWQALLMQARQSLRRQPTRFVDELERGPVPRLHARLMARAVHALYTNSIEAGKRAELPIELTTHARFDRARSRWLLDIIDDGPGVPEALRDTLMQHGTSGHPRGHGLGLALARRITEAHGGRLRLLPSERGATFRFELPQPAGEDDDSAKAPQSTR